MRQALDLVVVNFFFSIQAIAHRLEPLAAHIQRHAMRQVAALGQAHAEKSVARF